MHKKISRHIAFTLMVTTVYMPTHTLSAMWGGNNNLYGETTTPIIKKQEGSTQSYISV